MHSWFERVLKTTPTLALGVSLLGGSLHAENDEPFIYATEVSGEDVVERARTVRLPKRGAGDQQRRQCRLATDCRRDNDRGGRIGDVSFSGR